ncbi:MAG: T9SS type A sorting domain-containing protein [Candidatus Kapabacteria bacterium]|nr:T9SS type A sorting domain-containing protein [Ignavibacteriota bacterium]MCW5885075.1 T9SS type A sorting domain-containing protein [Candidatus Kapabacteria bacterium]
MKKYFLFFLIGVISTPLYSRPFRVEQVPNGGKFQCLTCHTSGSGGSLNSFGQEVFSNHLSVRNAAGNVIWSESLASIDSDGDGFTNGEELLDPQGVWKIGQSDPGNPADVGNPGNPNSVPVGVLEWLTGNSNSLLKINSVSPNPVIDVINLSIEVKETSIVEVKLFDISGRLVAFIDKKEMQSGTYSISYPLNRFSASLSSGNYVLSVTGDNASDIQSIVITK